MTAVAVWQHRPDADALLAARVADGWRPVPSRLQTGLAVLGHAACLPRDAWDLGPEAPACNPAGTG